MSGAADQSGIAPHLFALKTRIRLGETGQVGACADDATIRSVRL